MIASINFCTAVRPANVKASIASSGDKPSRPPETTMLEEARDRAIRTRFFHFIGKIQYALATHVCRVQTCFATPRDTSKDMHRHRGIRIPRRVDF
jgi:hypothetical protein